MKHIAITGGSYSGKSQLARCMDGYLYCNFTYHLKEITALALRRLALTGDIPTRYVVTAAQIDQAKEQYRGFLVQFNRVIGYDTDPTYIESALDEWYELHQPRAYFDNVRTVAQADHLRNLGFQIVKLHVPFAVRQARAESLGRSLAVGRALCENDLALPDSYECDLVLDGTAPSEAIAKQLIRHE